MLQKMFYSKIMLLFWTLKIIT